MNVGVVVFLVVFLVVLALTAVGYGLHRLALHADRRGWLYYRTKPRFKGSSLGLLEEIYHPASSHVIEEHQNQRGAAEVDESGAPRPTPDT